jgi:hypothetical protein
VAVHAVKGTPADAVLVAIDVSKLRNDVLIEIPRTRRRRRLVVLNTRPEHDRLIDRLRDIGPTCETGPIASLICFRLYARCAPFGSTEARREPLIGC